MATVEGRYLGVGSSEDEDSDRESEEGGIRNDEWYEWTTNIVNLAQRLNRDVDDITDMPYVTFLFWSNYFRLRNEEEYRRGINK